MNSLRIIYLEGPAADAPSVAEHLRTGVWNDDLTVVKSLDEFERTLDNPADVFIIADEFPGGGGGGGGEALEAIRLAQQRRPETPIIVIGRTLDFDRAVELIDAGASDCVEATALRHLPVSIHRCLTAGRPIEAPHEAARALRDLKSNLIQSETHRSAILDSALDAIITMDEKGRIVDFNPAAERTFGHNRGDVVGKPVAEVIIPPRLREAHYRGLANYLSTGYGPVLGHRIEMPALRRDGTEIPVEIAITPVRLPGTGPIFTAYLRDISERLRIEQALRDSEEQYRASFEMAAVGKAQVDPASRRFLRVNRALCELSGYTEEELLGRAINDLTHPDDRDADDRGYNRLLRGEISAHVIEQRIVRKDGQIRWINVSAAAFRDSHGQPLRTIHVVQDMTDRHAAEAELLQHRQELEHQVQQRTAELESSHQRLRLAERMAALGTLAAGLGHDIGNLLMPIRSRLDMIEARDHAGAFRDDVEAIRTASDYMRRLVKGLRLLALDPDSIASGESVTDLRAWWMDAEPVLRNALPRTVELALDFPGDVPNLRISPHLLMQAMFNLVQNAGDALHGRTSGQVRIWAAMEKDDLAMSPHASMVRLGVTDNGPGMTPEVQRRCLEPFFTTKARGMSTGLGLTVVHGIVRRVGGTLNIESELGKGVTFILTLPSTERQASGQAISATRPLAAVSLSDQRIRSYVDSVLDSLNFDVTGDSPREVPEARLWIAENRPGIAEAAMEFVGEDLGRRVVLLGGLPNGVSKNGILELAGNAKPGAIRQALRAVAAQVSPVSAMAHPAHGVSRENGTP